MEARIERLIEEASDSLDVSLSSHKSGTTVRSRKKEKDPYDLGLDELLEEYESVDLVSALLKKAQRQKETAEDNEARLALSDELSEIEDDLLELAKSFPDEPVPIFESSYQDLKALGGNLNRGTIADLEEAMVMLQEWQKTLNEVGEAQHVANQKSSRALSKRFAAFKKAGLVLLANKEIIDSIVGSLKELEQWLDVHTLSLLEELIEALDDVEAMGNELERQTDWVGSIGGRVGALTVGIDAMIRNGPKAVKNPKHLQMVQVQGQLEGYIEVFATLDVETRANNSDRTQGCEAYIRAKLLQYELTKGVKLLIPASRADLEWAAFETEVVTGWTTLRASGFDRSLRGVNCPPQAYKAPKNVTDRLVASKGSVVIQGAAYRVAPSLTSNTSLHRTMPRAFWTTNVRGELVKSYVYHL